MKAKCTRACSDQSEKNSRLTCSDPELRARRTERSARGSWNKTRASVISPNCERCECRCDEMQRRRLRLRQWKVKLHTWVSSYRQCRVCAPLAYVDVYLRMCRYTRECVCVCARCVRVWVRALVRYGSIWSAWLLLITFIRGGTICKQTQLHHPSSSPAWPKSAISRPDRPNLGRRRRRVCHSPPRPGCSARDRVSGSKRCAREGPLSRVDVCESLSSPEWRVCRSPDATILLAGVPSRKIQRRRICWCRSREQLQRWDDSYLCFFVLNILADCNFSNAYNCIELSVKVKFVY